MVEKWHSTWLTFSNNTKRLSDNRLPYKTENSLVFKWTSFILLKQAIALAMENVEKNSHQLMAAPLSRRLCP